MLLNRARGLGVVLVALTGACEDGDGPAGDPLELERGSDRTMVEPRAPRGFGAAVDLSQPVDEFVALAGPRLVRSMPAEGEEFASVEPRFHLYFDRPVDAVAAQGKITLEGAYYSDDPAPFEVQVRACEGDPTCLECDYPGWGVGPIRFVVTIGKDLPDRAGTTRDEDTTFSFRTHPYTDYFTYIHHEPEIAFGRGGIDYDPVTRSLLVCALECHSDYFNLLRLPLDGAIAEIFPGTVDTEVLDLATARIPGASFMSCDGLDLAGGALYAASAWHSSIFRFGDLVTFESPEVLHTTSLAAPDHRLPGVRSTAVIDGALYFGAEPSFGPDYADPNLTNTLMRLDASGAWEVWMDLKGAADLREGFNVAGGIEKDRRFLYVAADADATIYKIDVATRTIVNTHVMTSLQDAQLRTDSKGRLYVATNAGGIHIFRTAGSDGFTEVGPYLPIAAGRFALQEEDDLVHLYFLVANSDPRIGKASIRLTE